MSTKKKKPVARKKAAPDQAYEGTPDVVSRAKNITDITHDKHADYFEWPYGKSAIKVRISALKKPLRKFSNRSTDLTHWTEGDTQCPGPDDKS